MGIYQREVEEKVERTIKEAQKETDRLIKESALKSYLDDAKRYREAGKSLLAYEANERVQALVSRIRRQTRGEYKDLSRGLGLVDPITKNVHPLARAYKNALDKASFSAHLGVFSYQEASKKVIDDLSEQGLSWLNFETGTRRTLTAHVHTVIRTSLGQLSNQMTEINLEDMGECYVEVSAHSGARESHASWQGGQYYWRDKDRGKDNNRAGYPDFIRSTGYGTGEGLGGYNCRHTFYPFFPDSSTPAYTDKALKALAEEKREYEGKVYSVYEANQKLRAYERAIRKSKRKLVGYEALGDDEAFLLESVRHRLINDEYNAFARGVDLPIKEARLYQYKEKRYIPKANAQAYKPVEYGEKDRVTRGNYGIKLRELTQVKNPIWVSDEITLKPREQHLLDKEFNNAFALLPKASKDYLKPEIYVISSKEMQKNALATYYAVDNAIYIDMNLRRVRGKAKHQENYETLLHELLHWYEAQKYEVKYKKITQVNYNEYIVYLNKKAKPILDDLGINGYNVSKISPYAVSSYDLKRYDEVYVEYLVKKLIGE